MMKRFSRHFWVLISGLLISGFLMAGEKGYYRFPTFHGNRVVFTAEGDLWQFDEVSGHCYRMTTHHGMESHPAFSPDGRWIGFNAEYEGPNEIYILPSTGGVPRRITFEGQKAAGGPRLYGWTSEGKLLVSSSYYTFLPGRQLLIIDPLTLDQERLPLAQADEGVFDEAGNLYFTRLAFQGSHTKRYKGGTAQNIWKFDGKGEAVPLTANYSGTSKNPMFYQGRIYFLSDRDGTMNLWSMLPDGKDIEQLTSSVGWDLKDAELRDGRIIYQKQADIFIFDIAAKKEKVLDITLVSDFDQIRPRWEKEPLKQLQSVVLSPDGEHVLLTARGRIFSTPVKEGRWTEVTREQGVRFRSAKFLGTGGEIAFLSDKSGESELWKSTRDGFSQPRQLTSESKVLIMNHFPSPDGKYIAYTEKDYALMLWDAASGTSREIDRDEVGGMENITWSHDGKWLTYSDPAINRIPRIKVMNVSTGESWYLTGDRLDSYNPVFSRDGKWLFFISDRTFNNAVGSPWGPRQPEPFYQKTAKIYMLALHDTLRSPFLPANELYPEPAKKEEASARGDDVKSSGASSKAKEPAPKAVPPAFIPDFEGAPGRLYEVPVPADNIASLGITSKHIFWLQSDMSQRFSRKLMALEISGKPGNKPVEVADMVMQYEISADGKKMLIRKMDGIWVTNADGRKAELKDGKINLRDWVFRVDPKEDFRQMMLDAWRLERDYFYDKNMHGVDWKAVLERHLPLLERVTDRFELDDLLISMVSELSALHTFVYGGQKREAPDDILPASLGARLHKDSSRGGYVIDHIFRSDPDFPGQRSPLDLPFLKIREGDVILRINGVSTLEPEHINRLLDKKEGQDVRLSLSNASGIEYEEVVRPVSMTADAGLRYSEWEYTRQLETEKRGEGRIGYFHLRAMGGDNFQEFVKGYYPVFNREGLIIDVRNNRGGNIDSWILNRLMRKAWFYWQSRAGIPYWNMQYAFRGHIVVLCNESTASDGEAFAEGIRQLGLGEVIGTRTWGGEIWLSSSNRLVDGGIATASEMGVYTQEGEWIIEGHGVEPDIVVDNLPHETFSGRDAQLEAAIEFLKKRMKEEPVVVPPFPPMPDKSFDYRF